LAASHLAAICFAEARGEDAVLWASRALDRATPASAGRDIDALSRLLLSYGLAGRIDDGISVALARGVDRLAAGDGALGLAGLQLVAGQVELAMAGLDSVAARAGRDGPHHLWCYARGWQSFAAVQAGRWDEALAAAADAARAADVEAWSFAALGHFTTGVVSAARGDRVASEAALDAAHRAVRSAGAPRLLRLWMSALEAWGAEVGGDHEAVLSILAPWHPDELMRATGPLLPSVGTMAARALARLGRVAESDATIDALGPPTGRVDAAWRYALAGDRLGRHGDLDAARARYDQAMAQLPEALYPIDGARLRLELGALLRRAGKRRMARDRLESAAETFGALGARPFVERCDAELVTSGSTARSRRDPGDALVNVYRKLGVANRTQLATRLDGASQKP
jgi:tetratricopeptide (TPR) repeat protein